MKFPTTSLPASGSFCKLRVLALNQTGVTWAEVMHFQINWKKFAFTETKH